jgi:chorismate mutase/prephenate dehydratase
MTLRKKIDQLDNSIIELLNDRAKVAMAIAKTKRDEGKSLYSPDRESQVLEKILRKNMGPLGDSALEAIYREVMSASFSMSQALKVAYMGPEASFSNLAALKRFGSQVKYIPCESIPDVFLAVEKGSAEFGVVPVENSIEGAVSYTLDMFVESDLKICSQISLDVSHNLLSLYKKERIRQVYSNPQVFGQCRLWLQANLPGVDKIEVSSTTRAAQIAKTQKNSACIGSLLAAKLYKLNVLSSGIEDSPHNITKFMVVGKTDVAPTGSDKTSILFSIKDKVGALHDMLLPFKKYQINLTKIESRPSKRKAWDYYFYLDMQGHRFQPRLAKAIRALENKCKFLKVLGSYPVTK